MVSDNEWEDIEETGHSGDQKKVGYALAMRYVSRADFEGTIIQESGIKARRNDE
jgi:hypothetical protein